MSNIAIIPARSGSKGLIDKNIINLKGKPLIAYTIEAALHSGRFSDNVFVTTDSPEYGEIAKEYGAKVIMRNEELSNDEATSFMVIEHALHEIKKQLGVSDIDTFALLQPTSPLRNHIHINEAYKQFTDSYDFCVSMTKSTKSSDLIKTIKNGTLENYEINFKNYARQKFTEYFPNGAIFIARPVAYLNRGDFFGPKSRAYIMSEEDSIDIDSSSDLLEAINILNMRDYKNIQMCTTKRRSDEKLNNNKNEGSLLFLGHSVLDYYPNKFLNDVVINNLGISGSTTYDCINFLLDKINLNNQYKYILVMFGINDIRQDYTLSEFENNYNKLVKTVRDRNSKGKIILSLIMRNNGNIFVENNKIELYNDVIIRISNAYNLPILKWDDFYNNYGKVKYKYSKDGVHLTENGYELLTKKIYSLIGMGEYNV